MGASKITNKQNYVALVLQHKVAVRYIKENDELTNRLLSQCLGLPEKTKNETVLIHGRTENVLLLAS